MGGPTQVEGRSSQTAVYEPGHTAEEVQAELPDSKMETVISQNGGGFGLSGRVSQGTRGVLYGGVVDFWNGAFYSQYQGNGMYSGEPRFARIRWGWGRTGIAYQESEERDIRQVTLDSTGASTRVGERLMIVGGLATKFGTDEQEDVAYVAGDVTLGAVVLLVPPDPKKATFSVDFVVSGGLGVGVETHGADVTDVYFDWTIPQAEVGIAVRF
ncbi:MAG: hypothetical protein HYT76_03495 [Deltaproteobacteria bacterium]|nr:hypothetical protein [Deltaproteobacteria bacterium]